MAITLTQLARSTGAGLTGVIRFLGWIKSDGTQVVANEDTPLPVQGPSGGIVTKPTGAPSLATAQVTTGVSALVLAARATRRTCVAFNMSTTAAEVIYIKDGTVTTANGFPIPPQGSISIDYAGAVFAIAASGTPTIAFLETYD